MRIKVYNNGPTPHFTLTCFSIGGLVTTVTWTRNNVPITGGIETVLNDPETANYTHTLTVTAKKGGLYNCTVKNNKTSMASSIFTVKGIVECLTYN